MWNFGNLNHSVEPFSEPWNLYLWNLGTCKSGILRNRTLYVEPELLRVESLRGTWTFMWNQGTFKSGTCMWNLGEPELLRVEPVCGPFGNLNFWEWNLYSSQTRTLRARCQACCADTRVRKTTTRGRGSPTQKAPGGATPKAAALRTGGPRRSPAIHRRAKSGTFMWNFGEFGSRFRAAAPNHPEALLEEPQAFQAVGVFRSWFWYQW